MYLCISMRMINSDSPMDQGWLQELRGKLQGDLKSRSEDELATWIENEWITLLKDDL